jgi:hypothetical protein
MTNIIIKREKNESDDDATARAFINPNLRSAFTISAFTNKGFEVETGALIEQLNKLCKDDNFKTENMLVAQAHTLDAIFNNLAQTAAMNFNNVNVFVPLMKLAIQAQNQCGKTLQVISQNQQNKLLNGAKVNDGVDTSKAIETIEGDKTVATLVAFNGGKVRKRQKESVAECL